MYTVGVGTAGLFHSCAISWQKFYADQHCLESKGYIHVHRKKATDNFIRSLFIFVHHNQINTGGKSADFLSFFSQSVY